MPTLSSYNPDVITCLANLSSDEVFTPPVLANRMLDLLPQSLWNNPEARFLDPACKSGVFLREIAKRLDKGLEQTIPDRQERINHIMKNQLFGIAITELTALMARRTLYCSKHANGKYSVCTVFDSPEGNIRYRRIEHTWQNGRCLYCGVSEQNYDRGPELETHAYEFIHTENLEEIFNMKFDVIIGNPPYQLETGGYGRQAKPIYHLFIQQAIKLNPRYLTMIIPSRWFAGGMGLDKFRDMMINDKHIIKLVDFPNSKDCFPQNSISGGVCYFLRDKNVESDCEFINLANNHEEKKIRSLNEFPVLVRYNKAIDIIRKVTLQKEKTLDTIASSLMPFGLSTNVRGNIKRNDNNEIILHTSEGIRFVKTSIVTKGFEYIDKFKILISKTGSEHAGEPGKDGKYNVFSASLKIIGPNEICTHSYFVLGAFSNKQEAYNLLKYLKTKFVRFLVLQSMSSINISKYVFTFVPIQDFSKPWTDEELYAKYGLTVDEIAFIEQMIRPMPATGEQEVLPTEDEEE